jgi:hypothetical protein
VIVILSLVNLTISQIALIQQVEVITFLTFLPIYQWLFNYLGVALLIALMTVIASWKEVHANTFQKVWAIITFPFYSLTFLPLFILAPLTMFNLKWYKTPHSVRRTLSSDGTLL